MMTRSQDSDWQAEQYGKINSLQEWLDSRALSQLRIRGDERVWTSAVAARGSPGPFRRLPC
jgi:hypothetical protein